MTEINDIIGRYWTLNQCGEKCFFAKVQDSTDNHRVIGTCLITNQNETSIKYNYSVDIDDLTAELAPMVWKKRINLIKSIIELC